MLILDISCQHMGDECKLEGFCVPFGHRVGDCTYLEIYICIGYMTPKILGIICHLKIYVNIVYIMPTLGGLMLSFEFLAGIRSLRGGGRNTYCKPKPITIPKI